MRSNRGVTARLDALAERLQAARQDDLEAAVSLAIEIVERERAHKVLEPALDVLRTAALYRDHPSRVAAVREALRARFDDLTENGTRFDQGCELRVEIAKVLREIVAPEDRDLAERGLRTIQLQPPARVDVAQALRGQCLLLLERVDSKRAGFYAVDLLQDPHTSEFNGEPAVTAIQVLAERGEILPIWALARRPGLPPDVLAQAFASLRRAPADLQSAALLGHLNAALADGINGEGTALVAAEAIILNGLKEAYPRVLELLRSTTNRNLFLYLATTIARSDDPDLRAQLTRLRGSLTDPDKLGVLRDLLPS
jgi:hypothetical protein